ncbi:MAG: hypothetical protein PSN04_00640 [Methyloprofundus sp.]|nr:hypothetical protein [Methyloprofundus sp.]
MKDFNNEVTNENLTQKDIVQLLLHNAQHMVTREELKSDIKELKDDIKQDILKVEDKILKVESSLKQDISRVEDKISRLEDKISRLEDKISKVDAKFDKIQWLIIATMFTVLFKDYIFSFIQTVPVP